MNRLSIFSLLLFISGSFNFSLAQSESLVQKGKRARSIGISNLEQMDRLMYVVPGVGSRSREVLLKQDIKPYMMPIRRIGPRGNEMSYAVAICMEYYVNLERNYKVNLSPDFISLSLSNSGKRGTAEDALEFLVSEGTVSAAILPYDASMLTTAAYNTKRYSINNYLHMFRELTKARQKVFETRKALMRGNPVLIELQTGEDLKSYSGKRNWDPSDTSGGTLKRHPLIVVGYDEDRQAFEVMSVWGSRWGKDGYIWIGYDDFGRLVKDAFVMVPEEKY